MSTASEYAESHGVEFDWSAEGYFADETGWEFHKYTVTLTVGDVTESFTWRQGLGVESEPTVGDVLDALVMDAEAGSLDFDEFCDTYGYDHDSRKAYATWEQCGVIGQQLENLFGEIPTDLEDE